MAISVKPVAKDKLEVVLAKRKCFGHLLIGKGPVAGLVVQVVRAVL